MNRYRAAVTGSAARPLLFLDVDGPLIPFRGTPQQYPTYQTVTEPQETGSKRTCIACKRSSPPNTYSAIWPALSKTRTSSPGPAPVPAADDRRILRRGHRRRAPQLDGFWKAPAGFGRAL